MHVLERKAQLRGPGQMADRVNINFLPSTINLDFAGVAASGGYTAAGPAGHFGLLFLSAGDRLFLSTAGAGQPFSDFDVSDLAGRLQQVLVAMTAKPAVPLSSVDLLDENGPARLTVKMGAPTGWCSTQPATVPVSIPALFAAQVARAPVCCGGDLSTAGSMTYRELDEAANRVAHLVGRPGLCAVCGAAVFALRRGDRGDFGGAQDRGGLPARSIRCIPMRGSGSCSPMPRRSP